MSKSIAISLLISIAFFIFLAGSQSALSQSDRRGAYLILGTAETPFTEAALTASFTAFFGRAPDPATVRSFRLDGSGSAGFLTPGGWAVGVGYRYRYPVARLSFESSLELSYGERAFRLNEGFGVFRDPAAIDVSYYAATLAQDVRFPLAKLGPVALDGKAGAGVTFSAFRTRIRSSLLDVRSKGNETLGFARLAVVARHTKDQGNGARIELDLTGYEGGQTALSVSAAYQF